MRTVWVVLALGMLGGCVPAREFGAGFRDEMARQSADVMADAMDAKLGDDFKELSEAVREIPKNIPQNNPADGTLWGGLGTLAALVLSNAIRGGVRKKFFDKA